MKVLRYSVFGGVSDCDPSIDAQTPMLYVHVPPISIYVGADFLQPFFIVANDAISHLFQDGVVPGQNCQSFFAKDPVDCIGQSQILRDVDGTSRRRCLVTRQGVCCWCFIER